MELLMLLGPLVTKLLGLLAIVVGLLALYLGIKRKGKLEERTKWEKATNEAKAKVHEKVLEAVTKDNEIDRRADDAKAKIDIKRPGDTDDTFHF